MTTLHGLVTISELFAGFNLINTCVVNCLIMCQNTHKMHHSEEKTKTFLGRASPIGEGDTSSPNFTPFGALDLAPKRKSWIRQCF